MRLKDTPRLYRTVRHLKYSQLAWRVRYLAERKTALGKLYLPSEPETVELHPDVASGRFPGVPLLHQEGPMGPEAVAMLEEGEILHLNHRLKIGRAKPYWRLGNQNQDRLWTVTLHYHRWAYELAKQISANGNSAAKADQLYREYISSWIEDCDLSVNGARDLAWNCYAIATRIEWWIRACFELGLDRFEKHPDFMDMCLRSMYKQASFLYRHPEKDLMANHVLRDALGLAWAARFFDGDEPTKWMRSATEIAVEQAAEQVLPDGGHFERSPMYHIHVMEDIAKLAFLLRDPDAVLAMKKAWLAMAEFLKWVRYPDGRIPLFNDGGLHASAEPDEMLDLRRELGIELDPSMPKGARLFPHTGLVIAHGDPWTMFLDVGKVGPDHQPGHAHADTLALNLAYKGHRLFIDPGTHSYDNDGRRRYDRSTDAHNTVCVGGQDSSEMWHIFRVGRRAYPKDVVFEAEGGEVRASAAHNGYRHLPGSPLHHRSVTMRSGGVIEVTDKITGGGRHALSGGFLLDPDWNAEAGPSGWTLSGPSGKVILTIKGPPGLELSAEKRAYHPEYGLEIETGRLQWKLQADLPAEITATVAPD